MTEIGLFLSESCVDCIGLRIPCQQADEHHHLDYVQNIYVNWSLYKRSFNEVIIFSPLMAYKIIVIE